MSLAVGDPSLQSHSARSGYGYVDLYVYGAEGLQWLQLIRNQCAVCRILSIGKPLRRLPLHPKGVLPWQETGGCIPDVGRASAVVLSWDLARLRLSPKGHWRESIGILFGSGPRCRTLKEDGWLSSRQLHDAVDVMTVERRHHESAPYFFSPTVSHAVR